MPGRDLVCSECRPGGQRPVGLNQELEVRGAHLLKPAECSHFDEKWALRKLAAALSQNSKQAAL